MLGYSNELYVSQTPLAVSQRYVVTYRGGSRYMERTTVSHEDQVLQQERLHPRTGKVDSDFLILAWSEPAARSDGHYADQLDQLV